MRICISDSSQNLLPPRNDPQNRAPDTHRSSYRLGQVYPLASTGCPASANTETAAVEFETFSGLGTLPAGETIQMNPSRQYSQSSKPTDAPMHQRGTLIELLVMISIIGVLICDKQ
jgi:hypothetical protein